MKLCSLLFGIFLMAGAGLAMPHVLFISIDDMNDYISPLDNHPGIKTPNFDRLAKRSVTFANAHCAAPACHPSRVAVMPGVPPLRRTRLVRPNHLSVTLRDREDVLSVGGTHQDQPLRVNSDRDEYKRK